MKKQLLVIATTLLSLQSLASNPVRARWELLPNDGAPTPRKLHTANWTGNELLVWGGIQIPDPEGKRKLFSDGSGFNLLNRKWLELSNEGAPEARFGHTAVWNGTELIVWGGARAQVLASGGRYNPVTKKWQPLSTRNQPDARYFHTAVAAEGKMFIWGGFNLDKSFRDGFSYNPIIDEWKQLKDSEYLVGRNNHTMTYLPERGQILVFGGQRNHEISTVMGDGAVYSIKFDSWYPIWYGDSPRNRSHHTAVWNGTELFIWGGLGKKPGGELGTFGNGYLYNPELGEWKKVSNIGAPSPRAGHISVWTGKKFIIWGGTSGSNVFGDGALYDPATDTWETLPLPPTGFSPRYNARGEWTGNALILWGGSKAVRNETHHELGDGALLFLEN